MKKCSAALLLISASSAFAAATPEQIEFFERKIRPVLAQECYECHSSTTKAKGGLIALAIFLQQAYWLVVPQGVQLASGQLVIGKPGRRCCCAIQPRLTNFYPSRI